MRYWDTALEDPDLGDTEREFAAIWQVLPKIVFSRTLDGVEGNATLATASVADVVAELREQDGDGDIAVGGAGLAAAGVAGRRGGRARAVREPGGRGGWDAVPSGAGCAAQARAAGDATFRGQGAVPAVCRAALGRVGRRRHREGRAHLLRPRRWRRIRSRARRTRRGAAAARPPPAAGRRPVALAERAAEVGQEPHLGGRSRPSATTPTPSERPSEMTAARIGRVLAPGRGAAHERALDLDRVQGGHPRDLPERRGARAEVVDDQLHAQPGQRPQRRQRPRADRVRRDLEPQHGRRQAAVAQRPRDDIGEVAPAQLGR